MSPASSSSSAWKPRDSDKFPTGLRVLVVDDDPTCLKILEKMLKSCLYNVTKCSRAIEALSTLREHRDGFDVVISDVHMPDMDGFKLLEHIVFEMDLPVIMMSADDSRNVVMNGITHGACDYLIKPVRMEALRNIWQHVVRKRKNGWKDFEQSGSAEEGEKQLKPAEEADSSSANESDWRNSKKRKDEEEDVEDRDDNTTLKKPRVVWSVELHQQFVGAVNQLGVEKAVPKKILELMNVPGLTRENVASHLQKYRLYLRRLSGVTQHPCNTYISQHEATYGPMSSLSDLELQALAATGQLPPQSLASLQATGLGRSAGKSRIPVPFVDQSNIFSFENPKVRFGDGQQHLSSSNQINLLHGIPTAMDSKQLANFHHAAQSLVGMNASVSAQGGQSRPMMVRMSQSQSAGQILSETIGSHVSRLPNSMGQSIICNTLSDGVVVRNGLGENSRGASNPAAQSPSMLNFPSNNSVELQGSGFPFGSPPAVSSHTSKGTFQEEVSSNMKGTGDFIPAYDVFSDVHQQKSNNWESQSIGLNFTPSLQPVSLQSNLDIGHTYAVYSLSSNEQNQNVAEVTWPFNPVENASSSLTPHVAGHLNTSLSDHSVRIKAENTIYPESINQEDLMSALLKQQQTEIGQSENDFDFEGYHMDNIPA